MSDEVNFGPSGQIVYDRTYSRTKPNGEKETWLETVRRVAEGNLSLVYGPPMGWSVEVCREFDSLVEHMYDFKILPAGRHLWASGVKGRQYLMNCWVSGWGEKLSDHFEFTFLRLMEGGGVGANYSSRFLTGFGAPRRSLNVHIVCDPNHPDYAEMLEAGLLSSEYNSDWDGSFEVEDSREGWADSLVDLIDTFMDDNEVKHDQRVYDVSRVRCRGSRLKTFGGTASGPAPFARMMIEVSRVMNDVRFISEDGGTQHLGPLDAMEIDHAIAECVVSGGNRRSARMSIVRWDDPAIFDFIGCKTDGSKHWTTNISVEVDDAFFDALDLDSLTWERDREHARRVHKAVVKGMLTNGEPGYWNSSLSNKNELIPVDATNPCGEITLQAWEACNLGHVNLDAFASKIPSGVPDEGGMVAAHELVTRFLLRATWADINDPKSRKVQDSNRRIGVGHFGVQGFLVKQGIPFSEATRQPLGFPELLDRMYATVRRTARNYAYELRIPEPVKVTTVAPTGSIAKLPGATEGIHPIYGRYFIQRIRFSMSDPAQVAKVEGFRESGHVVETDVYDTSGMTMVVSFPTKNILVEQVQELGYSSDIVEQADELTIEQMLAFQAMYQKHYADNAVSFTVNVPEGMDHEEVSKTILKWLPKLKGTTVMVDGTREQAPFERISVLEYGAFKHRAVGDDIDLDCATGACPIR